MTRVVLIAYHCRCSAAPDAWTASAPARGPYRTDDDTCRKPEPAEQPLRVTKGKPHGLWAPGL